MADRPILYNGTMIRALLAEIKTNTRRILKPQPIMRDSNWWEWNGKDGSFRGAAGSNIEKFADLAAQHTPIKVGDRLWVREAICAVDCWDSYDFSIKYLADGVLSKVADHGDIGSDAHSRWWNIYAYSSDDPDLTGGKTVPSIHMPRWASRLTLTVTGVKVERLQDISEADAQAEGVEPVFVLPDGGLIPARRGLPGDLGGNLRPRLLGSQSTCRRVFVHSPPRQHRPDGGVSDAI